MWPNISLGRLRVFFAAIAGPSGYADSHEDYHTKNKLAKGRLEQKRLVSGLRCLYSITCDGQKGNGTFFLSVTGENKNRYEYQECSNSPVRYGRTSFPFGVRVLRS